MKLLITRKFIITLMLITAYGQSIYSQSNNVALRNFLRSSSFKYASVGVKVVDLETGTTVCSHNENTALTPASTLKLLTTASALEILGEDYVFKTLVYTDGKIDDQGILNGNIYIKGSGDPTLGTEYLGSDKEDFLNDWLSQLQKKGIKAIQGSVIVRDDLYGYEGVSHKWSWEDLGNYYASGTYGISIFDNTYRLYLKSGIKGTKPGILYTEPVIDNLVIENHLVSATGNDDSAYIYGIPFSYDRRIYGSIPSNRSSFVIKGDIPDPGLLLGTYFTSFLQNNGIDVSGKPSTSRLTEVKATEGEELALTSSNALKEIIKVTNFRSNNHFAEHLFYAIGGRNNSDPDNYIPRKSASIIKRYWDKKGIDTNGLSMQDGSGLSASDAISVNLLTGILVYMNNKSSCSSTFTESLPKAGREGTVRSFLKGTSLEGKAQIKSGSISGVQSYAGYIEKNGKRYAFSILVNNFTGSRPLVRSQIEQFLLNF